jgi:hypothetical protein
MKQLSLCCSTLGWSCHHGDQNGWKRGFKRRNLWRWHRFCCTNGCNGNLWIEKGSVTISVGICFSIFLGLATITQSFQWLYRAKKNSWTNLILTPEVTYPYPTEQPFAIWFGPPNVTSLIHNYSIAWRLAFASCVSDPIPQKKKTFPEGCVHNKNIKQRSHKTPKRPRLGNSLMFLRPPSMNIG